MSLSTVAQQDCEIREGTTSFGEAGEYPWIEGFVNRKPVALAFQTPPDNAGKSQWRRTLLATDNQPSPPTMADETVARQWVTEATRQHAEAVAAERLCGANA
ncbi:hypothetical protein BH11ACT6_BH11ACT6_34520 [soil metagenome]